MRPDDRGRLIYPRPGQKKSQFVEFPFKIKEKGEWSDPLAFNMRVVVRVQHVCYIFPTGDHTTLEKHNSHWRTEGDTHYHPGTAQFGRQPGN